MQKPEYDKRYRYVKIIRDFIHFTQFTWNGDDTGFFPAEAPDNLNASFLTYAYDGPNGWREAINKLHELGYEELSSFKAKGVIPSEWYPPETAAGCGRMKLAAR